MARNLVGESHTPVTPDAGATNALEPNSASTLDVVPPNPAAGEVSNEKAWEEWKEKGKGSARPPWWALVFGLLALSVVYWLWG